MTIWKFPLPAPDDVVTLMMPRGAVVLSVQVQHETPCVWALVDPEAPKVPRRFRWAGTGHPLDLRGFWKFVGTFQLHGGDLVFHLFDLGEGQGG